MGEYTVSCVCVLVVILWWMTLRRRIRRRYLLWFEKETSLHSVGVCVLYLCIHACSRQKACSAGASEKQFLSDSITTTSWAGGGGAGGGGQQEARGQHGLLQAGFLTRVWTKRPINSEMCTYKLDFTFPSFSPLTSQSFSHMSSCNWHPWSDI